MNILWVIVLVTSLQRPDEHAGLRVSMQYETRFTCEEAADGIDADFIKEFAVKHMDAKRKHIKVTDVTVKCVPASPNI